VRVREGALPVEETAHCASTKPSAVMAPSRSSKRAALPPVSSGLRALSTSSSSSACFSAGFKLAAAMPSRRPAVERAAGLMWPKKPTSHGTRVQ